MNTVLVTGGLGYVGGRLADYLRHNRPGIPLRLTACDRTRRPDWSRHFEIAEMNLLDPRSVADALTGIETVIHLAGLNEIDCLADPILALDVNTKGTYYLLKYAAEAAVRRILYVSTFHVYGHRADTLITEHTPQDPHHPYAMTHLAAEQWVRHALPRSAMDTVVFRLSNGYGYPMDPLIERWTLVFNDLCRQVVTTRQIVLKSSGRQCRDFIALHDVARAIDFFLDMPFGAWAGEVYNLGGACTMAILDVAKRVASVYERIHPGARIPISVRDGEDADGGARPFRYSVEKIRHLGFDLKGDMDWEIEQTLRFCIDHAAMLAP